MVRLAGSLLLLCALCAAKAAPGQAPDTASAADASEAQYDRAEEYRMFQWVNEERKQHGVPALKLEHHLTASARKHLLRVVSEKTLNHQFPGEAPLPRRIAETGYHFSASAENLALATEAADMHSGLMNSPGHRANILNPAYDVVGIGVIHRNDTYYAVQNFATSEPDLTSGEAEQVFAAAFAEMRKKARMLPLRVESSSAVRASACRMAKQDKLSSRDVPVQAGALSVMVFTSLDLKQWPANLREMAENPNLRKVSVGACFSVTPTYQGGTYWFAVVF